METALSIQGLIREFPDFTLGPVNLELPKGTVMALIGRNGTGKTTTMQCIMQLLKRDAGDVTLFGELTDLLKPEWKNRIGYVGDKQPFYEGWSVRKNLDFIAQFYPNWSKVREKTLIDRLELPIDKQIKNLSKGNRVKVSIVSALAYNPDILLLDEPTSGLDPVVRSSLLEFLFEYIEAGDKAILYSTHILSDINRIADIITFIDDGKVFHTAAKDDLLDSWRKMTFMLDDATAVFNHCIIHEKQQHNHMIVTYDYAKTNAELQALNASQIQSSRLSLDEITTYILKGGKRAYAS